MLHVSGSHGSTCEPLEVFLFFYFFHALGPKEPWKKEQGRDRSKHAICFVFFGFLDYFYCQFW